MLGAFPEVALAGARHAHAESRRQVAKGVHPVQARRDELASRTQAALRRAKSRSSAVCADWDAATGETTFKLHYLMPKIAGRTAVPTVVGDGDSTHCLAFWQWRNPLFQVTAQQAPASMPRCKCEQVEIHLPA